MLIHARGFKVLRAGLCKHLVSKHVKPRPPLHDFLFLRGVQGVLLLFLFEEIGLGADGGVDVVGSRHSPLHRLGVVEGLDEGNPSSSPWGGTWLRLGSVGSVGGRWSQVRPRRASDDLALGATG